MTKFLIASLAGLVAGLSAAPEAPAPPGGGARRRRRRRVRPRRRGARRGRPQRRRRARTPTFRAPRTLHDQLSVTTLLAAEGYTTIVGYGLEEHVADRAARRPLALRRRRLTAGLRRAPAEALETAATRAGGRHEAGCGGGVLRAGLAGRRDRGGTGAGGRTRGGTRRGRGGRRLGDLRRGRPLGRQHERQPVARRRARPDGVLRQRGQHGRDDRAAATAPRRPRSTSARRAPPTSPAPARARTRSRTRAARTSSPGWTSTTTARAISARPRRCSSTPRRTT